jgi:dTDP-4-amino-4,6-dideoxygalactose transaminase
MRPLPFNRPFTTGREFDYIREAIDRAHLSSGGLFSARCESWLERTVGSGRALLTHSCTAALEIAALLLDIGPGDEVVMPSFTFVSTANAFVLRGGVPVFVDVRPDTLNLDEQQIEAAMTTRTRAIVPVHYAGVACEMTEILAVAGRHGLAVVEDAAQGLGSTYRGTPVGRLGSLAATSFHETKNVISGEGGALLVNDARLSERAEILREKGTNRGRFARGEIDKYSWMDLGSSFAPSELTSAFLWAQMEDAAAITRRRLEIWDWYYAAFADLEHRGVLRRPFVPPHCQHNAHLFRVLLADAPARPRVLKDLNDSGVNAVFHYVPLHSSAAGRRFGRAAGTLPHTDSVAASLIRLPLWIGMEQQDVERVAGAMSKALGCV